MKPRSQAETTRAQLALVVSGGVAVAAIGALAITTLLLSGCSTTKHRRVLSLFFDGVPEPAEAVSAAPEVEASVGRRLVRVGEHGPFAAKLCDSCHDSKATNALVAPVDQLCVRCHELGETKAFVHGPLASGGCTVCHDPHRSANRFLLVSASDSFCLQCHDRATLSAFTPVAKAGESEGSKVRAASDAHAGDAADCSDCHDAHMSDRKYLLRESR